MKPPAAAEIQAAPEVAHAADAGQQTARLDDRRRALYSAGLAGTNLTGPMGITATAKTAFTSLLGGTAR